MFHHFHKDKNKKTDRINKVEPEINLMIDEIVFISPQKLVK